MVIQNKLHYLNSKKLQFIKNDLMKRIIFILVILLSPMGLAFSQSHFSKIWSGYGFDQMNFYVSSATINGENLQNGDEVAVFDGGNCVGVILVTGPGMLSLVASKDDPVTPGLVDGFREGNPATFKMWDASRSIEVTDITVNLSGGTLVFEASGSAFVSLAGSVVCSPPPAPGVGVRTHPTCIVPTGGVSFFGLPSSGTWTLKRIPGGNTYTGTGTNTTITGLPPGIYNFTVTNSAGCTSAQSENVVINAQPSGPSAPGVGVRIQPTCSVPTGSVSFYGLPSSGTWTLKRIPGGNTYTGTGTNTTVTELAPGIYNFTVTNSSGCTSAQSENVVINAQPSGPSAPIVGTITQPSCEVATGSVELSRLPDGNWTINPGALAGSGHSITIRNLTEGTFNYSVTNAAGCVSAMSENIVIGRFPSAPFAPVIGTIKQPTRDIPTGSIVLNGLPSAGTWNLTNISLGTQVSGTGVSTTIDELPAGSYTFKVTSEAGCVSPISASASLNDVPSITGQKIIKVLEDDFITITAGDLIIQDSDNTPSQMSVSAGSGNNYTVSEDNTINPSANFNGVLVVPVTVNDGIAVSHIFNASITVTPVNDQPEITNIPDQIIDQDSVFALIQLDDYISDVETSDENIGWTFSGNDTLQVTMVDRIVTITAPGPNWTGNDTIIFTGSDDDVLNPLSTPDTVVFTIKQKIITGNRDKEQLKAVIYPNPVKDVLHMVFSEQLKDKYISIEIITLQGTEIYNSRTRIVDNQIEINMKDVNPGNLLIRVISDKTVNVFQIVKK
jgi:hypothetical protein